MEAELYFIQVPSRARPVAHPIEFLPVTDFLRDEPACKTFWDMMNRGFHTRSKFLAIWPSVRFVALLRREGKLGAILLVSAPVNWQIDYVIVDESLRNQGIAAALVNETVNQALARRVPYVMLTSGAHLRRLYEGQCGFTVAASNQPPS
jgi:ribosomal protein S18 acetylase RimI-like enzyme